MVDLLLLLLPACCCQNDEKRAAEAKAAGVPVKAAEPPKEKPKEVKVGLPGPGAGQKPGNGGGAGSVGCLGQRGGGVGFMRWGRCCDLAAPCSVHVCKVCCQLSGHNSNCSDTDV